MVYEGMSHAQRRFNPDTAETKEAFSDIARFFAKYLGQ